MTLIQLIDVVSIFIIAIVCALTILKYHKEMGVVVTLCIFLFMLSCVALAFDEGDGERWIWSLPIFRVLGAIASVTIYYKLCRFWQHYGIFIRALKSKV